MKMKIDWKFIYNNVITPYDKIKIHLGESEEGKRYLIYFNLRTFKRGFIKLKKYNCAVLDTRKFSQIEEYISTIKGKNSADYFSRRCEKLMYSFRTFNPNDEINAIFEINNSVKTRQGRLMDEAYTKKITNWPNNEQNIWYGVFSNEGKLVSYLWSVKMKDLSLINRILGHDEHLKNNVMYFLIVSFVKDIITSTVNRVIMYDTFGKNQNGLVMFKKRIGFKPYTVNFVK